MQIVTAPPLATNRPGSLLAGAYTPGEALARIERAGYAGPPCGGGGWNTFAAACAADVASTTREGGERDVVSALPFLVQVERECSAFGWEAATYTDEVRSHLSSVESAAIARELWTGELATLAHAVDADAGWDENPRLAGPGATVLNGGTALPFKRAFGLLSGELGAMLSGEPGAIHMTREALIAGDPELTVEGANLLTRLGDRVIADAGYTGTGPTGVAPAAGEVWLYGTARPTVRRSDVTVTPGTLGESIDRRHNVIRYTAERAALVTLACSVIAVRATL